MIQETTAEHFDHLIWKRELGFYRDELGMFENQLEKLVAYLPREAMPLIEHFQNNFIRQHEVLDELDHEMNLYEDSLKEGIDAKPKIISDRVLSYTAFEQRIRSFTKIYAELKEEFVAYIYTL